MVAALSIAVDIGMGQSLEQGLRTCLVAVQLADAAGLDANNDLPAVFHLALLRHVGCTAESDRAAAFLGDETPTWRPRSSTTADTLLAGLDGESVWDEVLAAVPGDQPVLTDDQLDDACRAMADFADQKSHAAGRHLKLPPPDGRTLRQAGLVHDLGRVGVSAAGWGKPGPLTRDEWEKVRLHAYHTERALARPPAARATRRADRPRGRGLAGARRRQVNPPDRRRSQRGPQDGGRPLQHIYTKLGVSTRAGAALFGCGTGWSAHRDLKSARAGSFRGA